ncbi:MAG: thiazole biosynthesis adenylyltransferase ThiF, partial [Planctomycetes bacterium]|nr:thiazole biosynthesis adenylyltransferase ThiF [Planctomycetota bacterium]
INSCVEIEPIVADVNHESIEHFIDSTDLILDGTDNLYTRFLINDVAVKHKIPWVYGACLAAEGMGMTILPGGQPCLRCVLGEPPEPGQMETCQTAGVIGPIVNLVASFQAAEGLKILAGKLDVVNHDFVTFNLWENRFRQISLAQCREGCPCCGEHNFEYLGGKGSFSTVSLCGRNSVQIRPRQKQDKVNLEELAQ